MAEIAALAEAELSEADLQTREREIASRHMNRFPWGSVVWCFANLLCWLALWPLVIFGLLPLWLGFIIATLNVMLCYLPSHEAQHDIIARPGTNLRWLNQLVGHVSTIPLVLPYDLAKLTHMEHHKHANHPEHDPDYSVHAPNARAAIWKSFVSRQPHADGGLKSYGDVMQKMETPRANRALTVAILYQLGFYSVLIGMAWSGFALEAALLWWLPQHIGLTYIQFYLSWAPHHPGTKQGRYRDTRAWRSRFGNILTMGMQYHVIHHLYPRIPLMRTPRAYWEMRDILQARGVQIDGL
jgi:beta-carotene hydroxylase